MRNMRSWTELLNADVKKNPEIKFYVDNIYRFTEDEIWNLDFKKDIKKRLINFKQTFPNPTNQEIILSQRERIEKCITFSYKEDMKGKLYVWKNLNLSFDVRGGGDGYYEIYPSQPFWIEDNLKWLKMDTFMMNRVNPNIMNELEFIRDCSLTEYDKEAALFRNSLFDSQGGEIIDLTNSSPSQGFTIY